MRDIGILIWVAFLIIGVIGSIVSSLRKQIAKQQAMAQPARRRPPQWQAPPGQLPQWVQQIAAQVAPPPQKRVILSATPSDARGSSRRAAPPPPAPLEHPHEPPPAPRRSRRLFRDRNAIVQAVIAAEVLGKPRALRDEYL